MKASSPTKAENTHSSVHLSTEGASTISVVHSHAQDASTLSYAGRAHTLICKTQAYYPKQGASKVSSTQNASTLSNSAGPSKDTVDRAAGMPSVLRSATKHGWF